MHSSANTVLRKRVVMLCYKWWLYTPGSCECHVLSSYPYTRSPN